MIDFSGYTMENIQKDMLSQVPDTLDKRQGSLIQTAIGPAAWYLEGTYMTLAQIQENSFATTAVGEFLDLAVQERGITRKAAVPAVRQGIFDTPVPEGSQFKTINGSESVLFVSGALISSDLDYVYELTCSTPGTIGNHYTGNILPVTAIPNLTSAVIGTIITAGTDEETDESLRARYMATFDAPAFGGNIAAYRNTILAIEGVGAVQVYPAWKGGGTVLCSILGDDLKPALPATVKNVQNIICPPEDNGESPSANGYGMAPIGASVTITTATELTLNISCDIEFVNSVQNGAETYQTQIEEKIQEYLDSANAAWGNALKSHTVKYEVTVYLARIVYAILSIQEVVNVTNLKVNGSSADLHLTETAQLQQVAVLGTVVINGE